MTPLAQLTQQQFAVNQSNLAVLNAIRRIRAVNEELDPLLIEPEDINQPRDRRKLRRTQLQMPVLLIPVEEAEEGRVEVCGLEQLAITRDISTQGLGTLHDEPLLSDLAVVQFDIPGEGPIELLYEVRWSVRKTRYSYISGGRMTGVVTSE